MNLQVICRSPNQRIQNKSPARVSKGTLIMRKCMNKYVFVQTGEEISYKFLHGRHLASRINLDGSSMAQTQYIKDVFYHAHTKAIGISDGSQSCKMKILCKFGGKILPRPRDGKLRYIGGEMHIIFVPKNLSWKELVNKMTCICNQPHSIKYQLPGESLDSLITVSSDEDLQHMIEEYQGLERQARCRRLKIFLILASETENQYLFDTSTIQRGSPDYEYIVSMNSIWDPGHMENSNEQLVVSELNVPNRNSNQSPSFHEDLPFFQHRLEMKDNCSVPQLTQEKMSSSFPPKVVGPLTSTMAKEGYIDISEPNVQNHLIRIESMVPHREVDLLRPLYSKCCYQDSESTGIATSGGMCQRTKENIDKYSHMMKSSDNSNPLISSMLNKVFSIDSQLHQGIQKENRWTLAAHNQHDPFVIEDQDEYSHMMQSSYYSNPLIIFMLNKVLSIDSRLHQEIHKENRFTPTTHNEHDPFVVEDVTNCLPSDKEKLQIPMEEGGNGSTNNDFDVDTETYGKNANYQTNDAMDDEIEADICVLQIIKNIELKEWRKFGSGTYGTVYHGNWRGIDVAIKRMKTRSFSKRPSERDRLTKDFWREAQILSKLHHPNVLSFYGVVPSEARRTSAIVTEYMVDGSLGNILMKNDRTLDFRQKLFITMDAAFGMEYLHSQNIVHFDVKCDNLLVDLRDPQRPICKVGDLGLSRIKKNAFISGGGRGTLPWMAPELLDGCNSKVSEKVDVFSFGITMWEILTDEEPYDDMDCGEIIGGVLKDHLRPPVPKHCDKKWKKLMEQCWSSNPHARPSFTEIAARLKFMVATLQFHGHQYQNSVEWLVEAPEHEWSNSTLSCVLP